MAEVSRDPRYCMVTADQMVTIVGLMNEIGIGPDDPGMLGAQLRVKGPDTPYGYGLLTREQATALIGMMSQFLHEHEQSR